ncbi:thiamine phosphate synthase [Candidatus Kuenenia sp.]|uniref:thiamine phosphate synthase n=1 Tax=Candidatus Kuenenia sp. TaxID=2499824 RepID=UPI00321FD6D0
MENSTIKYKKRFSDVLLYVIISPTLVRKNGGNILQEVIRGGADAVQLREKTMPDNEFLAIAKDFREITGQTNTLFIINDRAKIAGKVNADGLHIGQTDMNINNARKIIGNDKIIGRSTHNIFQARLAEQEGADYISVGPLFYTATKSHEPPVGLRYLQQVRQEISLPFVVIGGITANNAGEIIHAGGNRIAICSAIICSKNITQATRTLKDLLVKNNPFSGQEKKWPL